MKIGILTFQNAVNYGAVLQAYALQNSIEKLGAEVRLIDYQCNKVNSLYDPFPKTTNLKFGANKYPRTEKIINRFPKTNVFFSPNLSDINVPGSCQKNIKKV